MAIPAELERLYAAHFTNYGSVDTGVTSAIYGNDAKFRIVVDAERRDFKSGGIKIGNEAQYSGRSFSWGFVESSIYTNESALGTTLMTEITLPSLTDAVAGSPCIINFAHRVVSFKLVDGTTGEGSYELLFKEYNGEFGIYYNNEKIGDIDNNGLVATISNMPFSGPYRYIVKYGEDSFRVTSTLSYGGQDNKSGNTQIIQVSLDNRDYQLYSVELLETTSLYKKYRYSFTLRYDNFSPASFGNTTFDYEVRDYKHLGAPRQVYQVYNTLEQIDHNFYIGDKRAGTGGYHYWNSLGVSSDYSITNYVESNNSFTVTFSNGSTVTWTDPMSGSMDISDYPLFKYNGNWCRMSDHDYAVYDTIPVLNNSNNWAIDTASLRFPYEYQIECNMTAQTVTYKIGNPASPSASQVIPVCPKLYYPSVYLERTETIILGSHYGYTSRSESTYSSNSGVAIIDNSPNGFSYSSTLPTPNANPTSYVLDGSTYPLKTSDLIKRLRIYYQHDGQEELVRDLVPVINTTTSVISMYDLANDQLYSVGTRKPFSTAGYVGTLVADYPYMKYNCNTYRVKKGTNNLVSSKKMFIKDNNGNLVPIYKVKLI